MTLVDAMALVAGVAMAIGATPARIALYMPGWVQVVFDLLQLVDGLSLAVSVVVLVRLALYRRMPRSSEWLAILVMAAALSERQDLNVDGIIRRLDSAFPGMDRLPHAYRRRRWAVVGVEVPVILAGMAALRLARNRLPPWSKSLALAGLATLSISGPLAVFQGEGIALISPSQGFGSGVGGDLAWRACLLAVQIPFGLLSGVPAAGALAERIGRRPWTWTEWAGGSLFLAVGLLTSTYLGYYLLTPPWVWPVGQSMGLIWLAIVLLLGRPIAARLGPAWRGWIGEPKDQPRGTISDETLDELIA